MLNALGVAGETAGEGLFGGNILAPRTEMTGPNSYADAIEELGITTLRYPGGSLTEYYYDISNPDANIAVHATTGEETFFVPLSDFMEYAGENGHPVSIVIPTRSFVGNEMTDAGDRLPDFDADILKGFVQDVVSGVYGDANVISFELGNEYWGSGEMNAAEYGMLANEMITTIADALAEIESEVPGASDISITVQMGTNYNYSNLSNEYEGMSADEVVADINATYGTQMGDEVIRGSGEVNWTTVNNHILISQLDENAMAEVDGVVAHVYSKAPVIENSRYYDLDTINSTWMEVREDLEIHVTEWNQKGSTNAFDSNEDYGLFQAHEMLNTLEAFMLSGVDQAQVWPLIQNTPNALSSGFEHNEATAPGEFFAMMSESLPGKKMIDFTSGRETEANENGVDVHGFAGEGELTFYLANPSHDNGVSTQIDFGNLIEAHGGVDILHLGVEEGENPGDNDSAAVVEEVDEEEVLSDGVLSVDLAPGEIMEITFRDVVPTDEFAPIFEAAHEEVVADDDDTDDGDLPIPTIPADETGSGDEEEVSDDGDDDSGFDLGGLEWALMLLPVLALAGFAA